MESSSIVKLTTWARGRGLKEFLMFYRPSERFKNVVFWCWMSLSVLLQASSIGSLTEGLVNWVGFFREFLQLYQDRVREPIRQVLVSILPAWIPPPKLWVIDLGVAWTVTSASIAAAQNRKEQGSIWTVLRRDYGIFMSALIASLIYLAAPFFVIVSILSSNPERKKAGLEVAWYIILFIGLALLILFCIWQLTRGGAR